MKSLSGENPAVGFACWPSERTRRWPIRWRWRRPRNNERVSEGTPPPPILMKAKSQLICLPPTT